MTSSILKNVGKEEQSGIDGILVDPQGHYDYAIDSACLIGSHSHTYLNRLVCAKYLLISI